MALIDSVKDAFGEEGLERVLTSRCTRQRTDYAKRIKPTAPLGKKLEALAQVRSEEGYMAEIRKEGEGSYRWLRTTVRSVQRQTRARVSAQLNSISSARCLDQE